MIPSSSSNYVKKGRSLRPDFADEILFNKEMTQELLQAPTFHPSSGFREQPYDIPYLKRMNRRKTNSFNAIPQYHNRSQQLHTSQIYTDPAPMQYRQKKHHTFAQLHPNEYQSNNFENLPVFDKSNYRPNKYQNNFVPEQKIIPTDSSRRINARNYANQSNVLNFSKRRIKKKLEKNVKELSKHNIASRSALFSTSNKNNQSRTNLFVFPNSIAEPVPNYFNEDPSFQRTLSSSTDIDDYVAELNDKFPTSTNRSHSATSSHHPDSSYNHKTMNDNVSTDIQYSKDQQQQQQQQQQYNHKNSSSNSTPHYYNYHQSDNSRHHQQQQQQMSQPKPKQKQKQLSQDNYYETTYSSSSEKSKNDKNEVNSEEIRDDIGYKPHGPKIRVTTILLDEKGPQASYQMVKDFESEDQMEKFISNMNKKECDHFGATKVAAPKQYRGKYESDEEFESDDDEQIAAKTTMKEKGYFLVEEPGKEPEVYNSTTGRRVKEEKKNRTKKE